MAIKFLDSCSSFTVMNSILTGIAYAAFEKELVKLKKLYS